MIDVIDDPLALSSISYVSDSIVVVLQLTDESVVAVDHWHSQQTRFWSALEHFCPQALPDWSSHLKKKRMSEWVKAAEAVASIKLPAGVSIGKFLRNELNRLLKFRLFHDQ